MLRVARSISPPWRNVSLTVLDRQDLVSDTTRLQFEALGWHINVLQEDALDWAVGPCATPFDLCFASLFLHHFAGEALLRLMRGIAARADAFVALEPRRGEAARLGSRLVGLLGANEVTRDDAMKSVAAGFSGQELTNLWPPTQAAWWMTEYGAVPFSHCFVAALERVRAP